MSGESALATIERSRLRSTGYLDSLGGDLFAPTGSQSSTVIPAEAGMTVDDWETCRSHPHPNLPPSRGKGLLSSPEEES